MKTEKARSLLPGQILLRRERKSQTLQLAGDFVKGFTIHCDYPLFQPFALRQGEPFSLKAMLPVRCAETKSGWLVTIHEPDIEISSSYHNKTGYGDEKWQTGGETTFTSHEKGKVLAEFEIPREQAQVVEYFDYSTKRRYL